MKVPVAHWHKYIDILQVYKILKCPLFRPLLIDSNNVFFRSRNTCMPPLGDLSEFFKILLTISSDSLRAHMVEIPQDIIDSIIAAVGDDRRFNAP